jgi:pimeloyl-ACP methyl ester carboxylesterase
VSHSAQSGAVASFDSFDGIDIVYYHWAAPATGDAALPPVVLHHGFAANTSINWVAPGIVAALVSAGREVFALDARGHGASGKPHDPAQYGESAMSRDLSLLFDVIGAARVHLAGYSMGAIVSLLTAAADGRVTRLVVGGVGAGVVERGGVDTRAMAAVAAALLAEDVATIIDQRALAFRRFADMAGGDRLALAAQAAAAHQSGFPLAAITAPTLVLAGADDPLADRPDVLAGALPGGTCRLVPGNHLSAVNDPAFAPAIVDFLAAG